MVGAPTCVGDIEYIAASGQQAAAIIQQAVTQAAIQAVIALWQRNASDSIATMQDEIAKEQMAMAEAIAAHVQSFWPELKQYIKDVFSITKQTDEYVSLPGAWGRIVSENLSEGRQDWLSEQERLMCESPGRCDDIRWQRLAATVTADAKNFGARQGEHRVQTINDWRFELQSTALAIGQRIQRGYNSYASIANTANSSAGAMLASGINATMEAVGYFTAPKPMDFWASGIRQELSTSYAPSSFRRTNQPTNLMKEPLDFSTPRIQKLENKPEKPAAKEDGYWNLPYFNR